MTDFSREMDIEICGETLHLKGRFECMKEIQNRSGLMISELMAALVDKKLSVDFVPAVIYGGLVGAKNTKYSYQEICEKCMDHGLFALMGPATKFFALCIKRKEVEVSEAKNEQAPQEPSSQPTN